jgi:hypothetical protein
VVAVEIDHGVDGGLGVLGVTVNALAGAADQGFGDRGGGAEVHVRDPEGQDIALFRIQAPFEAVAASAVERLVEERNREDHVSDRW